MTRRIKNC